jgi:hypothetical protein
LTPRDRGFQTARVVARAILAVLLAVAVLALAGAPHVHATGHDGQECAACAASRAAAAPASTPDVAPAPQFAERVVLAPGLAPVTGAPLGAIPGQSPPVA